MKILHITTHVGGGVGRVLLKYLSVSKEEHEVMCLGYCVDKDFEIAKSIGVKMRHHMEYRHEELKSMIPNFDIVVVHYWNHPLLHDFLVRNELPPCRLIIWGHISGLHPPNVYTKKILDLPDVMVFTSPLSHNIDNVKEVKNQNKLFTIWSTGGVDEFSSLKAVPHNDFVVGYLGTVDYAKMHPKFLSMTQKINIPNVKFVVVGGPKEKELEQESKELGIDIEFVGYATDIEKYYAQFDVFGYPLYENHYGTCDQVLQMSMAAGVVPVVFSNPMELTIVEHMKTGIVVDDEDDYVSAIEWLYESPNLLKKLSKNAREEATKRFSLTSVDESWTKIFDEVLKLPKTPKKWDINKKKITGKDVWLESLGKYGKCFADKDIIKVKELAKKTTWQSETKGTVHNYNSYFSDPCIKKFSKLMRKNK